MNRKKSLIIFLGILMVILLPKLPSAQEFGTIQATATVIAGMVVTGEHDLIFGTVLPDVDKIVDKADIGFAGEWHIQGSAAAEITIDIALPLSLLHQDSLVTMPINFSNTDLSYDDGTGGGQAVPVGQINPNGPVTLDLGATGEMDLWIGGTVRPGLTQTGGDYTADVTMTVQYTGN